MYKMFVNLPAEIITQGVSYIDEECSKLFLAEYIDDSDESNNKGGHLALLRGIQQCWFNRYSESLCLGHWWTIKIGDWNCSLTTCDTRGFSDTGAWAWDANSAMRNNQIPAHRNTPGGNSLEVLPLPSSRRRHRIELCYAECDWICALAATGSNLWICCT